MKKDLSILFLGKAEDVYSIKALEYCQENFSSVSGFLGKWGQKLPEGAREWRGDYVVSFLSRWIVPEQVLAAAKEGAINFHPGPPEYPGVGCNNFALYDNVSVYGATCHHMKTKVDTGDIIAVARFPVESNDDVASLLSKTYNQQLLLFKEIVKKLSLGIPLPISSEKWTRKPYTRTELDALGKISLEMNHAEITKRIRATQFGAWKPTLEFQGFVFELKTN